MSGPSPIEWTDATWNPTRGCTRCSPGCVNCYAERIAARFSDKGMAYEGLAKRTAAGARWTGKLRLVDEQLFAPLRWSKPRRIFVNSMSDLFHEALPVETIARVFAVMYLAPRHTFQVLTKRAERMREVLTDARFYSQVLAAANGIRNGMGPGPYLRGRALAETVLTGISNPTRYPAPWVWLGVSVENQQYANERIPRLLETPAGLRFLSCEPLLEQIDLTSRLKLADQPGIDWVIVGGESGPGARRFDVAWARRLMNQCTAAGVAFFMKQVGANVIDRNDAGFEAETEWESDTGLPTEREAWPSPARGIEHDIDGHRDEYQGAPVRVHLNDKAGGDMAEWPFDLRRREFPEVQR